MQTKITFNERLMNGIAVPLLFLIFLFIYQGKVFSQQQEKIQRQVLNYVDIRAGSLHHYLKNTNSLSNFDVNLKIGLVKLGENTFLYSNGGVYSKNFRQDFIVYFSPSYSRAINLNIHYNTIYYYGIGVNKTILLKEFRLNTYCALNFAKQKTLIKVEPYDEQRILKKNTIQNINVGIQGIYDLGKGYGIGLDVSLFREFQISFLRSSRDNDSPSTPFLTRTPTPLLSAGINLTISKSFYRKQ